MAAEDRMREDGMGWAARRLAVTFKLAVVRGWSLRVIELQVAKSASPKYGKAHVSRQPFQLSPIDSIVSCK